MFIAHLKTLIVAALLISGLVVPSTMLAATGSKASIGPDQSAWRSGGQVLAKKGESDKGKEKEDKPGKGKGRKHKAENPKVAPIPANTVSVSCTTDAATGGSTCAFSATGPNGQAKIKVLYVLETVACSSIIETSGTGAMIDEMPAFASRKNHPELTLVVSGAVSVGGSATYWVEAGKQLIPVSGPGLICADLAPVSATPSPTPPTSTTQPVPTATVPTANTPTPGDAAETGTIEIRAFACPDAMTDADADWFRSCPDAATGLQFHLAAVDPSETGLTAVTDANGTVTFDNLRPGVYKLNLVDVDWCRAKSNSVDSDGQLVVDGETAVTVWIFTCVRP